MVTTTPGIALCIFSADCVPILLADRERGVIGALHAGWRGTLANIAAVGVYTMIGCGARREFIEAALGPSVGVCCFEIDAELGDQFAVTHPASRRHIRPGRPSRNYLDLRGIISDQLTATGLDSDRISMVGPCTKCLPDVYFSRRAAGGATTGLQMSFIALEP
jgi:YfiH family protein